MKKFYFSLVFAAFFLSGNVYGQLSLGGVPESIKNNNIPKDFAVKELVKPDMEQIQTEDAYDEQHGILRKVGRSIYVNINLQNSGTWYEYPNGDRLWRLKIHSEGALALGVYYSNFWLPAGSRLYLYNEDKTQIIGAFTSLNNSESGLFATELIAGETVILEFFEPSRAAGHSVINISEIAYIYRDFTSRNANKNFGDADYCEVNVNCSEGNNWQDQKKGVARISIKVGASYSWCSGSLLNNQRQDCTPYFLTADHCGTGASTNDMNQWIFYFNYEAPSCANPSTEPTASTMTGCSLKAHGGNSGNSGSDFYLVQLNQTPTFGTYYNGWDRNNTASSSGVSIHHPSGDIKKISTYTTSLVSDSWGSVANTHWRVVWASTTNGHGVTEGGSSGSPIFNSNKLVVGDLTGGGSYCSTPTQPDMYGKFSYSWDMNGTTAATRLKDWLDPDVTNITTLSGKNCGGTTTLIANFSASATIIPVGGTVDFTDLSTGGPTSWTWTFNGGTPGTSSIQNPTGIQYNAAGIYTVSLTISDGSSSDTETKTNYIIVGDPPPVANFVGTPTSIPVGGSVNFTDLSAGNPTSWAWTFNGGTPASSTIQNPTNIVYNTAGTYTVELTATNANGSDTETKINYIVVGGSGPTDKICDTLRYPLPGQMVLYSIRYASGIYSYISGNNGFSDKSKADYFIPSSPYIKLIGAYYKFGKAVKHPSSSANIAFHLWDNSGPGGTPGNIIYTDSIPLSQLVTEANSNSMTFLSIDPPLDITGPFYLGVELPTTTGDTLALLTNKKGQSVPCTAWEQWRNGSWYQYSDTNSWGYNVSHAIFPIICKQDYGINAEPENSIVLYPNPASSYITVNSGKWSGSKLSLKLYNIMGMQVLESEYDENHGAQINVNISGLKSGVYFIRLSDGKNFYTGKFNVIR